MLLCACSTFETVDGVEYLSCPAVVANTSFLSDSASVVMDPFYYGYQVTCIHPANNEWIALPPLSLQIDILYCVLLQHMGICPRQPSILLSLLILLRALPPVIRERVPSKACTLGLLSMLVCNIAAAGHSACPPFLRHTSIHLLGVSWQD